MPAVSEALFHPLGIRQHKSERWLYIRVNGAVRSYRPTQALGMGFLLTLHPDANHWRAMFPSRLNGHKIDSAAACAYVARLCERAGEYDPASTTGAPSHLVAKNDS